MCVRRGCDGLNNRSRRLFRRGIMRARAGRANKSARPVARFTAELLPLIRPPSDYPVPPRCLRDSFGPWDVSWSCFCPGDLLGRDKSGEPVSERRLGVVVRSVGACCGLGG